MADAGISVTPCNVFTSSRVLTNWFGKSTSVLLSKTDRAFTVPVVVSIWLSSVNSFPLAIFVCAVRSKASTVSTAFLRSRAALGRPGSFGFAQDRLRPGTTQNLDNRGGCPHIERLAGGLFGGGCGDVGLGV